MRSGIEFSFVKLIRDEKKTRLDVLSEIYVDRKVLTARFDEEYKALANEFFSQKPFSEFSPHVICYQGESGMGKSHLLHHFEGQMKATGQCFVRHSFPLTPQTKADVIASLSGELERKYRFRFPFTKYAFLRIYREEGRRYGSFAGLYDQVSGHRGFSLSAAVSKGFSAFTSGQLSILGDLFEVLDSSFEAVQDFLESVMASVNLRMAYRESNFLDLMKGLSRQDAWFFHTYLHEFFINDMFINIERTRKPVVFLLDDADRLASSSCTQWFGPDSWIVGKDGLISSIPGVIWVFSGRHGMERFLLQSEKKTVYEVASFTEDEVTAYCTGAGFGENMGKSVFEESGGIPFCVSFLCMHLSSSSQANEVGLLFTGFFEQFARNGCKNVLAICLLLKSSWDDGLMVSMNQKPETRYDWSCYHELLANHWLVRSQGDIHQVSDVAGRMLGRTLRNLDEYRLKERVDSNADNYLEDRIRHVDFDTPLLDIYIDRMLHKDLSWKAFCSMFKAHVAPAIDFLLVRNETELAMDFMSRIAFWMEEHETDDEDFCRLDRLVKCVHLNCHVKSFQLLGKLDLSRVIELKREVDSFSAEDCEDSYSRFLLAKVCLRSSRAMSEGLVKGATMPDFPDPGEEKKRYSKAAAILMKMVVGGELDDRPLCKSDACTLVADLYRSVLPGNGDMATMALSFDRMALDLAIQNGGGLSYEIKCRNNLGISLRHRGKYGLALENDRKCLELREKTGASIPMRFHSEFYIAIDNLGLGENEENRQALIDLLKSASGSPFADRERQVLSDEIRRYNRLGLIDDSFLSDIHVSCPFLDLDTGAK